MVKSNEKPSVCNTFAALYLKNPVNMGTYSSPNVNKSYPRDNHLRIAHESLYGIFKLAQVHLGEFFVALRAFFLHLLMI